MSDNVPFDYHHLCLASPYGRERQAPEQPVSIQLDRQINHLNNQPTHGPRSAIVATGYIERRLVFLVRPPSRSIDDRPDHRLPSAQDRLSIPRITAAASDAPGLLPRISHASPDWRSCRPNPAAAAIPFDIAPTNSAIQPQPYQPSGDLHDST